MKTILCMLVAMAWNNALSSPTILIVGTPDKKLSRLFEVYVEHYAETLRIDRSIVLIDVSCQLMWQYKGLTHCEPFKVDNEPVYCIRINGKLSVQDKLKTLAHEMIHAQQYNHGLLQRIGRLRYCWQGKKTYNLTLVQYGFRPWEKDAFSRDTFLFQHTRRQVKKWMKRQP